MMREDVLRSWPGIVASAAVGLGLLVLPLPVQAGHAAESLALSWEGRAVLAVTAACIVLWVTEALPFAVTALLAFLLLPLTGVGAGSVPQRLTLWLAEGVGSPVVAFLLGVMLLGVAVNRSGLGLRMARFILSLSRGEPRLVILGFMTFAALLGMWITPVAMASIAVPMAVELLERMAIRPGHSNFGKALLLASTWGSLIGGIATPAGTTSNPIVIQFLHSLADIEIGFLDWMRAGLPMLVLLLLCAWVLLIWLFPPEIRRCEMLPVSGGGAPPGDHGEQLRIALLLAVAVVIWILLPGGWVTWSTLLLSLLLFVPRLGFLRWRDAEQGVAWGALLVVAAGVALGTAAYRSGLARYLAHLLFARLLVALPPFWCRAALSWATALLHAVFSSNTVTGSIVAPLLIPLAQDLQLDVWPILAPAAYSVSLAFLIVSETPTSLIAYQAGYFSARDYMRAGLPMTLVTGLVVALVLGIV